MKRLALFPEAKSNSTRLISRNKNIAELKKLFDEYYIAVMAYSITIVKNKDDAEIF